MAQELCHLLNIIWNSATVPDEWRKGMIVRLPKRELSNCNCRLEITLLSVPGEVLCSVLLNRLKDNLDKRLREEKAGFCSGRSCSEFNQKVFINFVDFKRAFDSIHQESVWNISKVYGIPEKYISIFKTCT